MHDQAWTNHWEVKINFDSLRMHVFPHSVWFRMHLFRVVWSCDLFNGHWAFRVSFIVHQNGYYDFGFTTLTQWPIPFKGDVTGENSHQQFYAQQTRGKLSRVTWHAITTSSDFLLRQNVASFWTIIKNLQQLFKSCAESCCYEWSRVTSPF